MLRNAFKCPCAGLHKSNQLLFYLKFSSAVDEKSGNRSRCLASAIHTSFDMPLRMKRTIVEGILHFDFAFFISIARHPKKAF